MSAAPLHLAGELLLLDPEGAVFWPDRRVLALADLHLEKGSAAAAGGRLLPPWDSRATIGRLAALLRRYRPGRVVALGDSFHDAGGPARLGTAERARLAAMAAAVPFLWLHGNHDPEPPAGMPGESAAEWRAGPLVFRHQAGAVGRGEGELCGHLHPRAAVMTRGARIARPCFIADARRLLLPAFGTYAGGLDVAAPAVRALFPRGGRMFLLGRERLYGFPVPAGPPSRAAMPSA